MKSEEALQEAVPGIISGIARCRECPVGINLKKGVRLAGQKAVSEALADLLAALFPGCHGCADMREKDIEETVSCKLRATAAELRNQCARAFAYELNTKETESSKDRHIDRADEAVARLIEALPQIQLILQDDITAGYKGDPAAKSTMEVVLSYPGFKAVAAHRIAHVLYCAGVPLIPRMISEDAHARTGIDIHPGATIGRGMFIDHGTGTVIGETCVIGNEVKIYQGVTLGALSFALDDKGNPLKGRKRHPDVEDNVTIYSGATILGNITIGRHSVIGGNVWLTHTVPAFSRVYNRQPTPLVKQDDGKWKPWQDPGAGI